MRTILLSLILFFFASSAVSFLIKIDGIVSLQQEKNRYITLQLHKYEDSQLTQLIDFLLSQKGKIAEVIFNKENRRITIYYTSQIKLDDIYQLVGEYFLDFDKVSGTEIE